MPSYKRRKLVSPHPVPQLAPITQRWILRLVVALSGHREWVGKHGFSDEQLALALGLQEWVDLDGRNFDAASVQARLRELHRQNERKSDPPLPAVLQANIARLSALVGMNAAEGRLLGFATLLHQDRLLDTAADLLGVLSTSGLIDTLAVLLDLDANQVRAALSNQGVLARSGLLSVDRSRGVVSHKLDLISERFAAAILECETDPIALLRDTVAPSQPAQLDLSAFPHLERELAILRPYLQRAIAINRAGVNILIHGAPGTGKSELARALAAALECELFEVASEDDDGDPINGERRLRAYRAAQSFFSQRNALLMFDEVEDVFSDGGGGLFRQPSTAQKRKAWLNRMLEQNRVPALWVSNSIEGIDPAFLRRFDVLVEVPIPPRALRASILQSRCGDLADAPTLALLAQSEVLAPAVVDRVASVVRSIRDTLDAPGAAQAITWLTNSSLQAQRLPGLDADAAAQLPAWYDPAILNADTDLAALTAGLARQRAARLCLYGPPGTGKSAFGRWLAQQLDLPLVLKRASDLMSKWVGESEKAIAAAFRQAEREGAILLIDEVDSFLRDRGNAQHSWEATMVNEMLTRMESYNGIFIASTNLMEGIDQAALRRFDIKIRVGYLKPEQAEALLTRQCAALGLAAPGADDLTRVRRLAQVTPGDFALLARRHRFSPFSSCAALLAALEEECALKQRPGNSIGFLA